ALPIFNNSDDISVSYFNEGKQPINRNEIGGSLGGPILKDHVFFFASVSPRFSHETREYKFSSGRETGELERKTTAMSAFGKATYANNRLRADLSALFTPTTV